MIEKRKCRRIEAYIDVIINRIDTDSISRGKIKNISSSGICLMTDYNLCESITINLIFHLPNLDRVIGITGETVWNKCSTDNTLFFCGIKFIQISQEYKELIMAYISNKLFDNKNTGIPDKENIVLPV